MQTFEKRDDSKFWRKFIKNIEDLKNSYKEETHKIKKGDDVLYVGEFIGKVIKNNKVKLRDGTVINSLNSQPHKFRKLL